MNTTIHARITRIAQQKRQTRKTSPVAAPTPGWAVYLRTSSEQQQKPELSRERQRLVIEKQVLEHSDLPVYGVYIDVQSGKNPMRPSYQRLLADARAGKFSHVVVDCADRFGRDDTEALCTIDELDRVGVAVRFANAPDLDPMDPDDRVVVALSFILACRKSVHMTQLAQRVKRGLRAKRLSGSYVGRAPDGYIHVWKQREPDQRRALGRFHHGIEFVPERAALWREAWALLLTGTITLVEIAQALHAKGYRHRSGQPFVEVTTNGTCKPITAGLLHAFQDWTYAGWVVSERDGIAPKTVRGNWEALVSTEEFEAGLVILERLCPSGSDAQR
jgi:DNA invertase Pin-like site-specific DNA recombinase